MAEVSFRSIQVMSTEAGGNSAAESISSLDDEDLLILLQSILEHRTGVLQALVDWAVPGFVYIPSKAITEHRILGTVKSCSYNHGFGAIACPEVQEVFNSDVILHANQSSGVQMGDVVNFAVLLNKDQKPQAFDVLPGEPGGRKGGKGGHWKGSPDEWWGDAMGWGGMAWSEWAPSHPMASPAASVAAPPAAPERIPPAAPQAAQHPMAAPSPGKGPKPWGAPAEGKGYGKDAPASPAEAYGVPAPPPAPTPVTPAKGGKASKGYGKSTPVPMEGVTDRRFEGAVKSFNHAKGFGFISCDEVQGIFGQGVDVFTHHAQIGDFAVGDQVSFSVILNKDSKPQAMDLWPMAETAKRSRWS